MPKNSHTQMTPLFKSLRFILLDLEFTAWPKSAAENWAAENEWRELIAVGAVKVDTQAEQVEAEYKRLVRPKKNNQLSTYIQNLTGIEQCHIDESGCELTQMLAELHAFCEGLPIYCYGWDALVIAENLMLYGIDYQVEEIPQTKPLILDQHHGNAIPLYGSAARIFKTKINPSLRVRSNVAEQALNFEIHNFKPWLLSLYPQAEGLSSGQLGALFGGEHIGRIHDPLFDVKSEFYALCKILKK